MTGTSETRRRWRHEELLTMHQPPVKHAQRAGGLESAVSARPIWLLLKLSSVVVASTQKTVLIEISSATLSPQQAWHDGPEWRLGKCQEN